MHDLLRTKSFPFVFRDGPARAHHWGSGWLPEAVALLLKETWDFKDLRPLNPIDDDNVLAPKSEKQAPAELQQKAIARFTKLGALSTSSTVRRGVEVAVYEFDFDDGLLSKMTPGDESLLAHLPDLERLEVGGKFVDHQMFQRIIQNCAVRELELIREQLSDEWLRPLDKSGVQNLKLLGGAKFSRDAFFQLDLSALRRLEVGYQRLAGATPQQWERLRQLTGLEIWDGGENPPPLDMSFLRHLPNLETLWFSRLLDDTGFEHVATLAKLDNFSYRNPKMTDRQLERLRSLPRLEVLAVDASSMDGSGFASLVNLPIYSVLVKHPNRLAVEHLARTSVRSLKLDHCKSLASADLALLAKAPYLDSLSILQSPHIDDSAIEHLIAIPRLQFVTLMFTGVTESGLNRLRTANPRLFTSYGSGNW